MRGLTFWVSDWGYDATPWTTGMMRLGEMGTRGVRGLGGVRALTGAALLVGLAPPVGAATVVNTFNDWTLYSATAAQTICFLAGTPSGTVQVRSSLVGRPNVYNIMAAVSTAVLRT